MPGWPAPAPQHRSPGRPHPVAIANDRNLIVVVGDRLQPKICRRWPVQSLPPEFRNDQSGLTVSTSDASSAGPSWRDGLSAWNGLPCAYPYLPRFTLTRTLAIGRGWSGLIEFLDALFTFPSTRRTQFGLWQGPIERQAFVVNRWCCPRRPGLRRFNVVAVAETTATQVMAKHPCRNDDVHNGSDHPKEPSAPFVDLEIEALADRRTTHAKRAG